MKTQREQITELLEKRPELRQRKFRYVVASILSGVDEETCKLICSIADEYRHQTEVDEEGSELELKWHKPKTLWNQEAENKRIMRDKLLFG